MVRNSWLALGFILLCAAGLGFHTPQLNGYAMEDSGRQTDLVIPFTQYEWWLIRWANNEIECQILTDHEGLPTGDDVFVYCGETLYEDWVETDACPQVDEGGNTNNCKGYYLHLISTQSLTKTVHIDLPTPEVWISINDCDLVPPENRCEELPGLLITGEEPLPNERITGIQGTYNEVPFMCQGETCEVPLRPTTLEGAELVFWAESSYGDTSDKYSALVRVIDTGVSSTPNGGGWYVDVISARWLGEQTRSCAQIWGAFPPIGGPPTWLSSPEWPELLASDEPYAYLAGRLIAHGIVDAHDCPAGGLLSNGYASTCGLDKARSDVDRWQNRFDAKIVEAAENTGVPAQLLKNIFAQESQFWPGAFTELQEYGLGQLTELGADTVLLWNQSFFFQFCPLVLESSVCELGYAQLGPENQATLRGALITDVNAECPDCPAGIDLSHADFSVEVFAQTLKANCEQTGQIISNETGQIPGAVSNYDDLWRFTLVNYHAGPGCLAEAVEEITTRKLRWDDVSAALESICPGVIDYVETISQ
jgi:hypothetical protein